MTERSHVEKISNGRKDTSTGQHLGQFLLDSYRQGKTYKERAGTNPERDKRKWNMFAEIIGRITNDVAGNRYALGKDGGQYSFFDHVFSALNDPENALKQVLNALPTFTKGIVQTPHPTEVLKREAIDAEDALHTLLENNNQPLFETSELKTLAPSKYQNVLNAMDRLYQELEPLRKPLTPEHEMIRSVEFSEVMFDSIPIVMETILDGAERSGVDLSKKLDLEQLSKFNFMLQPETWSPGDRDSKELMTAEMLQKGIELNELSIKQHYVKILAEMIVDFNHNPDYVTTTPDGSETTKTRLQTVMCRLLLDINSGEIKDYLEDHLQSKRKDEVAAVIQEALRTRDDYVPYKNEQEFISDLTQIREIPNARFMAYVFSNEQEASVDKMDTLLVQANNFGFRALRSQIRENRDMHAEVMVMLLRCLEEHEGEGKIDTKNWGWVDDKENMNVAIQNAMKPDVVKHALDVLMEDKEDNIIHTYLTEKLKYIEDRLDEYKAAKIEDDTPPEKVAEIKEKQRWVRFYETLKGFQIAAENPQAIPRYLIAECENSTDVLTAFFMLKAMEPNETRHLGNVRERVEIVPLFEHREHVEQSPQTLTEAYQNRHFRTHHNGLTHPQDPAINERVPVRQSLTLPDGTFAPSPEMRRITVAEAKEHYGIKPEMKDKNRLIEATKLVMYAGSDITKSAGSGGAGLVMHTTNEMRKTLLDLDHPVLLVDYTGVGGGMHRSQPVSTAYETAQGRSLRQTPQSIAQKILLQAGRAVSKFLGLELPRMHGLEAAKNYSAEKDAVLTAELNMGNLAGLQWNNEAWGRKNGTGERLSATMTAYQGLYDDPAYAAYMGYSADPFVKLTSYAARSAARVGSKSDQGFPPLVDVANLRAIGYGAALNASGSCAGLYYGASAFLKGDENGVLSENNLNELKDLYLKDPIAQDRINRATYGVVMADLDTAWNYLGRNRTELLESGELDNLAQKPVALNENAREEVAVHILAKIDKEYQRVSKGLLQLHRAVKMDAGLPTANAPEKTDAQQLLLELPRAYREQLQDSLWHITSNREFLATEFQKIVSGKKKLPTRDDKAFDDIYFAMGSIFETFENAPRATTRHRWAVANELMGNVPNNAIAV